MLWVLFVAMAATVPLLFFAFVVGGFLPLLVIAFALTDTAVLLLVGIHLAVYAPILFLISWWGAKSISRRPEHQHRYILGGLVGALLLLGFVPMYGISHGSIKFRNAYEIYGEALNVRYVAQAPRDWSRNWSPPNAGQTLYICSGLFSFPGQPIGRRAVYGWQHAPALWNPHSEIRWGIEAPAQDKQYLDHSVKTEFERVTPRAEGFAGKLARILRTHQVEPWKYGEVAVDAVTYYCVSAQYPVGSGSHVQPTVERNATTSMAPLAGSAPAHGLGQEIVLLSVTETRNLPGTLWFAGKGYALVNGGSAAYFWQSSTPPQLEIEIRSNDPILSQCESQLKQDVPAGKVFSINGGGSFRGSEISGMYIGVFKLDSLSKCEVAARK